MFDGLFLTKTTEKQQLLLDKLVSSTFGKLSSSEIESELIEHPMDIMLPEEQKRFLINYSSPTHFFNYKFDYHGYDTDLWFTISDGIFYQQFISKITFFIEIPYLEFPLDITMTDDSLAYNFQNKKIEKNLNKSKELIDLTRRYFVSKMKVGGYEVSLPPFLKSYNPNNKKTLIMISNLPLITNMGMDIHHFSTLVLTQLISKALTNN